MRFLALLIFISLSINASAVGENCLYVVDPFWADARTAPTYEYVQDLSSNEILYGEIQNAAVLREFFSPQSSKRFHEWLKWVRSEEPGLAPGDFPNFYYTHEGLSLSRHVEYPIDAGRPSFKTERPPIMDLLQIPVESSSDLRGDSDKAKNGQKVLLDKLNMQMFGVYYAKEVPFRESWVMRVHWHPGLEASKSTMYPTHFRVSPYPMGSPAREFDFSTAMVDGIQVIDENGERDPEAIAKVIDAREEKLAAERGDPLEDLKAVVDVLHSDSDVVLIKIPLGRERQPKNRNQEVIQQMFFITYWQMVQKAYRETGLFPDDLDTAILLVDDFIETMKESSDDQNLYLMYDAKMWDRIVFRMSIANQYVSIKMTEAGWQPYQYQSIPDVFSPFYPIFGVTTEKYPTGEVELKRLFDNRDPDPLEIIYHPSDRPFEWIKNVNNLFFNVVAKDLENETDTMVVVSKTKGHNALYRRMGFDIVKEEFHEEWGTNKWTLKQTIEHYWSLQRNHYQK